ncbi:MAG: occludin/ELL family protein [Synechococcus sp.]
MLRILHASAVLSLLAIAGLPHRSIAQMVVCTTTFESPDPSMAAAPVEITRCGPVERTDAMLERRFTTWTPPYEKGVDVLHQFTDVLGIAVAGSDGNQFIGFGFPDQTIVRDAIEFEGATKVLMEEQSAPIPWRTADIPSGYNSSLASDGSAVVMPMIEETKAPPTETVAAPVRGLW